MRGHKKLDKEYQLIAALLLAKKSISKMTEVNSLFKKSKDAQDSITYTVDIPKD
jgi:hypothetical protein